MKISVSTVAFSTNKILVAELKKNFINVTINEKGIRIPENELVNFYKDAEGLIIGLEKITPQLLDQLPKLKIIAKYGVGLDNIDIEACNKRNIQIGWTGGVNKRSVAEMALGFMLALTRNLYITSNQLKNSIWNKNGGFQLTGKTIGIIGVGNIGKELIEILKPFNCNFLLNDVLDLNILNYKNALIVEKNRIYNDADFISIHTPLTKETENLINSEVFKKMKSTSFLINTARGGIVNEKDLKYALKNGVIAGAALDVYDIEPPNDLELLNLPNLICTPHTGGNAQEAVLAMGLSAIQHLIEYKSKI
jgi:phosphoglycerate dehydrogenase-like enzyme